MACAQGSNNCSQRRQLSLPTCWQRWLQQDTEGQWHCICAQHTKDIVQLSRWQVVIGWKLVAETDRVDHIFWLSYDICDPFTGKWKISVIQFSTCAYPDQIRTLSFKIKGVELTTTRCYNFTLLWLSGKVCITLQTEK